MWCRCRMATTRPGPRQGRASVGWSNGVLVIGGAIGGAVGVSTLVGWNGDPLETLAGVFLIAPVAGGYLGHMLFLALWARGG
jgi:hypothetical protein